MPSHIKSVVVAHINSVGTPLQHLVAIGVLKYDKRRTADLGGSAQAPNTRFSDEDNGRKSQVDQD